MAELLALWLGSPAKLIVWLTSRAAAWTGVILAWRKLRHAPNRMRRFALWMLAINAAAWLAFAGGLWCLKRWGG